MCPQPAACSSSTLLPLPPLGPSRPRQRRPSCAARCTCGRGSSASRPRCGGCHWRLATAQAQARLRSQAAACMTCWWASRQVCHVTAPKSGQDLTHLPAQPVRVPAMEYYCGVVAPAYRQSRMRWLGPGRELAGCLPPRPPRPAARQGHIHAGSWPPTAYSNCGLNIQAQTSGTAPVLQHSTRRHHRHSRAACTAASARRGAHACTAGPTRCWHCRARAAAASGPTACRRRRAHGAAAPGDAAPVPAAA